VDAGYRGRGKERTERSLGLEVEIVNRSPKPPPEKILRAWAREWFKEGHEIDLSKLPTRPGFENLPRRWVAERTFAWISQNRRIREAMRHRRSVDLGGDDATHGKASGTCLRIFRQSRRNCLENRTESRIGVPKAARRGEEESIGRLLAPKKRGRQAFSYFPNSFSTHSGE
jgi:transposase